MNKAFAKFKHITTLLAGISIAAIPAVGQADWSIVALERLDKRDFTGGNIANALNDSGQVVGTSGIFDNGFITGPNGVGMTELGTFWGETRAYDISSSGQVVGTSFDGNESRAYLTGPDGVGMKDLGSLFGYAGAITVNDSAQVAGYSYMGTPGTHAFITGPNGVGMTDLDKSFDGSRHSLPAGINEAGQVVFNNLTNNGHYHAYMTGPDGVGITELGTLGGKVNFASSINDSGQIVGWSNTGNGTHAFITGPNGVGMTDLGTLGGGKSSNATSINDSAEVIGTASAADGSHHAFLYSHGGMTDLSMLDVVVATGWTDIQVTDINNNGQIVGYGTDGFNTQAFLLSYSPDTVFDPQPIFIPSIPEPEIYAMLLGGLGLIGFMARRRKAAVA